MPNVDWAAPVAAMIQARPSARMTFGREKSECSSAAQPREAWFSTISICMIEFIPCFESFLCFLYIRLPAGAQGRNIKIECRIQICPIELSRKKRLGNGGMCRELPGKREQRSNWNNCKWHLVLETHFTPAKDIDWTSIGSDGSDSITSACCSGALEETLFPKTSGPG